MNAGIATQPRDARRVHVRGIVQGVGFRPFVFRIAHLHGVHGWVLNGERGVEIHVEGSTAQIERFLRAVVEQAPPAANIVSCESSATAFEGFDDFTIRASEKTDRPTVRVSPDLPLCSDCERELFDPSDRRFGYPYINCTNCGPRYSIIRSLPYDRPNTTMAGWTLCAPCEREYHDPANRRFHAQPVACAACGPTYVLRTAAGHIDGDVALQTAVSMLRGGAILAIKGLGGYHLACDAAQPQAVRNVRERKYRKERPFALMARDLDAAKRIVELPPAAEALLFSIARPIVLLPARVAFDGVAPHNREFGVMLPYTPLQSLLFAHGAPEILVMTSANRSNEPIAYEDDDARDRLTGIADAFLTGEREIARRVDDSVARVTAYGTSILRHARGYAPRAVATLPTQRPMLCVGADLKNAVTVVVDGQAFVSQHIGDLDHFPVVESFKTAIRDLCEMYELNADELTVVHDAHPEYVSTAYALSLPGERIAVQHHRAHVASVLAEREAFDLNVAGVAFDGTGYGDDGTIWGGEFFTGSLRTGFRRVMSLRPAALPGGDAAARFPVQAAAGFLAQLDDLPDLMQPPFAFPDRYGKAMKLVEHNVRTFTTTSMGRLFDTVAALLGFTREITFEGQAAMWLEHIAWQGTGGRMYAFPVTGEQLDFRPLLRSVIDDRVAGEDPSDIARAFHVALADTIVAACEVIGPLPVVASGGVFQNALLIELLYERLGTRMSVNAKVPANDGGISLGQAAIAACKTPA